MTLIPGTRASLSSLLRLTVGLAAFAAGACSQSAPPGAQAGGAGGGAMPPMPVEMVTLQPKPVDETADFVGTIKSRRSTTVQPQAEGILTKLDVKAGDKVEPG